MKIGIDARFFGVRKKGLGRYTQKLVENLERLDQSNEYFVFLRKDNFEEYVPQAANFKKVLADFPWYSLAEQLYFPKLLNNYRLDLVHFPHFNVPLWYFRSFVVTIHDLILYYFPTTKNTTLNPLVYWIKYALYKLVIRAAIFRSNRVITVSEFTRGDILKNFPRIPKEKIKVTYEACEDFCMLSPNKDQEILARYGIMKPYLMYVGNAYPHKNLERLVKAFKELKKDIDFADLQMVFVGQEDHFYRQLKELVAEIGVKDIVFADYVPDHDLDIFFHNTLLYVWPSLYEGFGLSPLEAMAKGVPVVSSDHPCMREILGDSAYFFDGRRIERIVGAIKKVAKDQELRKNLMERGYQQIRRYSWKEMAEKTREIYAEVCQK